MNTWNQTVTDELNLHGWNIPANAQVSDPYPNEKHLFLRVRAPSKGSNLGTRFRLSVEAIPLFHESLVKKVRALVIDSAKPNWKASVARWVSIAVMETAEAAEQVRSENQAEVRLKSDRLAALAELVSDTGYTLDEFRRRFSTSFAYTGALVKYVDRFTLDPDSSASNWDPRTQVQKCARLLTFLEQEGWTLHERNLDQ